MIRFRCRCGRQLQAAEGEVGREVRCPLCQQILVVPERDGVSPEWVSDSGGAEGRGEVTREPERDPPIDRPRPPLREEDDDYPRYSRGEGTSFLRPETCNESWDALRFGILSIVCCLLASPIAIICAVRALVKINRSDGRLRGRDEALAGLLLGILGAAFGLLFVGRFVLGGLGF